VTKNNHIAHTNLGVTLEQKGRIKRGARRIPRRRTTGAGNFMRFTTISAICSTILGHPNEALVEYRWAVLLKPSLPYLHNSAGMVLAELGRFDESHDPISKEAARLDPTYPTLGATSKSESCVSNKAAMPSIEIDEFRAALRIDPDNFQILAYTAHVLAADENPQIRDGPDRARARHQGPTSDRRNATLRARRVGHGLRRDRRFHQRAGRDAKGA